MAELSAEYVVRGQTKQRLIFYPLRFKAETGELLHCTRIRIRVEFANRLETETTASGPLTLTLSRNSGGEGTEKEIHAAAEAGAIRGEFIAPTCPPELQRRRKPQAKLTAPPAPTHGAFPPGQLTRSARPGRGSTASPGPGLLAAGLADADIDALDLSRVQLFHLGAEKAIYVHDANGNHRLDAADHITFYAAAVPAAYTKFAKHNLYWLIDAGSAEPPADGLDRWHTGRGAVGCLSHLDRAPRAGPDLFAVGAGAG